MTKIEQYNWDKLKPIYPKITSSQKPNVLQPFKCSKCNFVGHNNKDIKQHWNEDH